MVRYLSAEWLELLGRATADLPERAGASAKVQHVLSGAPDGEVRYHQHVVDGQVVETVAGDDARAEITFTQPYAQAREIAEGVLDVHVGFMQGRVKLIGDVGKMMALMPMLTSDEYRAALHKVSAQTDY